MKRLMLALCLAIFWSGPATARAGTACPDVQRPFQAPSTEVVEIISEWFSGQGYAVRRDEPGPGRVLITAWKSEAVWEVVVRPQSALASTAAIFYENAAGGDQTCRRLRDHVHGYLLGTMTPPPADADRHWKSVPRAVLDELEAVVCIRAGEGSREVQFSGFVIDPDGLVLCTAHDLTGSQRVTLAFSDGARVPGMVARIDAGLDLALIEFPGQDRAFVSLSAGRNLLERGEAVFSIGCPSNLPGQLSTGIVDGPPRLVDNQPLWQVNMEIEPGSSGSPVFDDRGRLVAMVKGRYRGTSTVGFLTPLETIMAFLLDR